MKIKLEIGDKFNDWTAVQFITVQYKKGQIWKFKCSCGFEQEKLASYVVSGASPRCSNCVKSNRKSTPRKHINSGDRFGRWTALQFIKMEPNKGQIWRFRCDCGSEHEKKLSMVTLGRSNQCFVCARKQLSQRMKQTNGENHPNWKGGKYTSPSDGYVYLSGHFEHPRAIRGRVAEHRYLMEKKLGRFLYEHEEVHHKNGIRDDNNISNLELWSTSQPSGQRVADKIEWALQFLKEQGIL
jgi:hypothetical protein